jgi:disulfide bond formation protein DsbB
MLMGEKAMNEIALLGGSFVFVFALSYQQQNIFYRRYFLAVVNAAFIASLNLFVVKVGSQATPAEMLAFIAGQPLGTVAAMWLSSRRLASPAEEAQIPVTERNVMTTAVALRDTKRRRPRS